MAPRRRQATSRPQHRLLYEILGIKPSASPAEVQRAYRLRALQVHPDKNPGDVGATEAFQRLQLAYETLNDPERRQRYDECGEDDLLGEEDGAAAAATRELIRARFRPVTLDEILEFERTYRGSQEERDDVAQFVCSRAGDIADLLEHTLCSKPEDLDRLVALVQVLLQTSAIPKKFKTAVERSTPKLRRKAASMARQAAREHKELEKRAGALGDAPRSLEELALAIRGRQMERARALDELAEGVTAVAVGAAAVRKKPAGCGGPVKAKRAKIGTTA